MHHKLKCETKSFYKNTEENLQDLQLGKEFLYLTPKVWSAKEKLIKLTSLKLKNFALKRSCEEDEKTSYEQENIYKPYTWQKISI